MLGELAEGDLDLAAPAQAAAAAHRVDVHAERTAGLQQRRADGKAPALAGRHEDHELVGGHGVRAL